jgi:cleavage and polyadenylation specificity factor subunit 3
MFLEAQFGADAFTVIEKPKLTGITASKESSPGSEDDGSDSEADLREMENAELERLHGLGIPVPGIEIKVDKMVARVWLEDLDVECANRAFGDRVRAVVDRAVEVVAPLFQQS